MVVPWRTLAPSKGAAATQFQPVFFPKKDYWPAMPDCLIFLKKENLES